MKGWWRGSEFRLFRAFSLWPCCRGRSIRRDGTGSRSSDGCSCYPKWAGILIPKPCLRTPFRSLLNPGFRLRARDISGMNLPNRLPGPVSEDAPRCAPSVILAHVTTVPVTLRSFFRGQVAYLEDRGFTFVGVSSPGADLDEFADREGVSVYGIPMIRGISVWEDLKSLLRLSRLFRRIKPHIVHGSTPKAALLSMMAATIARVPVRVYTLHGLMIEMPSGLTRWLFRYLEWITCHLADRGDCGEPVRSRHHGRREIV